MSRKAFEGGKSQAKGTEPVSDRVKQAASAKTNSGPEVSASSKRNGIPTRRLGRIPYDATVIGLGGATVASNTLTIEEGVKFTHSILDEGVNYIDVAPSYGDAESKIGPVMTTRREEVFLACKTGERSKEGADRELMQSLKTLQTDHFDLYQLHGLNSLEDAEKVLREDGALAAFLEAKEKGLIHYIGITSHIPEIVAWMLNAFDFDSILVPLNSFDRFVSQTEAGVIQQARIKNAAVIAMKPWLHNTDVPNTETAFRYVLSRPISVLLPRHMAGYMEQAIKVAREFDGFSREEEEKLLAWYGSSLCRQCNYCIPCPKGIDIPLLFRLKEIKGRFNREDVPPEQEYASLPFKADACDECGECEKYCPFQIPIVERLKEIHRVLTG
jgi:hypothetical protein